MTSTEDRRWGTGGGARLRRLVHQLRTERGGPRRDAVAVGVGVFIGCSPLYGLHLVLSLLAADLFRLNRLKVYLAANISNPFVAPFMVFAEIQTGAWIRSGRVHALSREALTAVDPWVFGLDLVVGSIVIGLVLGGTIGLLTWAALEDRAGDPAFARLVDRAAARYAAQSLTAWEFASAKLRGDFVYRLALDREVLPGRGVLLDIGCGQGLMIALLLEAGAPAPASDAPRWPDYARFVGIEARPRIARLAARALESDRVEIVAGDAGGNELPSCSTALLFDVLHMMPRPAQDALLARVRAALEPDGVLLVREADSSAGWRFQLVRAGNRLKAFFGGRFGQTLAFRTRAEWQACFAAAGFDSRVCPAPGRPLLGNVLFRLTPAQP